MSFHIALSLRVTHEYWGDETPPLRILPSDMRAFTRAGLLAKPAPARLDVVAETALLTEPTQIACDVYTTSPDTYALTQGLRADTLPIYDLGSATEMHLADAVPLENVPRLPGDPLLRLLITLDETGTRNLRLHLQTVSALWAYHFTGDAAPEGLQITDPTGAASFDDLGTAPIAEGHSARILRSDAPIKLRYRSDARFTLEARQDPPFDPITLIPVLPAAGVNLRPTDDPAAAAPLQSDIFVSLW
ncbi:hypothetical protein SAMN04488005_1387 [Yoonia tamlensis]|uniref:Uncharacterized protein n=1 Tax=Yoonia tamlensis TaxID=390270 RepID=A0A1I6GBP5_9RHOB|nr:hypothetical protein [Yoonia tamlensis]SFR39599.1 hypothetical protein SAMN04488005_1387 [Yoonia tamlensis]